jgi:exonuclease SbcC
MRLISLRLRQWRSYEDCTIEFPDGLIGVQGPNGAGKSTAAEAIGWALFGKRRHRAKVADLRRQGAPKGAKSCVELEFQLGPSSYRIERFVGGDARLWINGELETQKATDTNARVAQELDLTWEVFQRTVFAQQKDVAALDPTAGSDQRKSHVERLLGLERFKNAATRAKSDAKLLAAELDGLRQLAPDLQEIQQALKESEKRAAEGDPAVASAKTAWEQATKARADARKQLAVEQERVKTADLLKQRQESEEGAAKEASQSVKRLKAQIKERTGQLTRLGKLAPKVRTRKATEKTLGLWDDLAAATQELEEVEEELAQLPYDRKQATAEQSRLSKLIDERAQLLAHRPNVAGRVAAAKARLEGLRAAKRAGSVDDAKAAVKKLEADVTQVQQQVAVTKAELAHDEAHVGEVETGGPYTPCPVCRKPYGDEYGEILNGYRTRIAASETRLPALQAECQRLQKRLHQARETYAAARQAADMLKQTSGASDAATAADKLEECERELGGIDARLVALKREIPEVSKACEARSKLAARWQELDASRKAQSNRVSKALKVLDVSSYDAARHAVVRTSHGRLLDLEEEATALRVATADMPHLKRALDEKSKQLKSVQEKLGKTKLELAELALAPSLLARLERRANDADDARDAAQEALTATKLEAQNRSQDVRALRTSLREAKKAQEAIAAKATDLRQHEVAADLLSKYRDQQARRAWPRLEQVASALLNAATDGRYADVKLASDYRLIIVDRGEEHELTRFSGGEQDLANLCLRLAIADWVSKERNVDLGFVILDEVFGSQDEERRQRLLSELRALSNRFRQMLVITHLPEIAELCDAQLEVSLPEPGRSIASLVL